MRFKSNQFRGKKSMKDRNWYYGGLVVPCDDVVKATHSAEAYIAGTDCYGYGNLFAVTPGSVCEFSGMFDDTSFDELEDREQIHWFNRHRTAESWRGKSLYEEDIVYAYNKAKHNYSLYIVKYNGGGFYFWDLNKYWHPDFITCRKLVGNTFDDLDLVGKLALSYAEDN